MGKRISYLEMELKDKEHEKWPKSYGTSSAIKSKSGEKPINPYDVGGGFLTHCIKQGWVVQEGKGRIAKFYATEKGKKELKKFGIEV